jgi:hypothetical protein
MNFQPTFIQAISATYGSPITIDANDLETSYRELRAHMEGEYSMRCHSVRTAGRRVDMFGGYAAPGVNFMLGATEGELAADNRDARRSIRANEDMRRAIEDMDEYDRWARLKGLLAILTGRYDGLPGNSSSNPVESKYIKMAYWLRKRYARDEWEAGVRSVAARRRHQEDWRADMDKKGPPPRWGKNYDSEPREEKWFKISFSERISMLNSSYWQHEPERRTA